MPRRKDQTIDDLARASEEAYARRKAKSREEQVADIEAGEKKKAARKKVLAEKQEALRAKVARLRAAGEPIIRMLDTKTIRGEAPPGPEDENYGQYEEEVPVTEEKIEEIKEEVVERAAEEGVKIAEPAVAEVKKATKESLAQLRGRVSEARKTMCPPIGKMKRLQIEHEIHRLREAEGTYDPVEFHKKRGVGELKKELRELRKKHCPPVSRMPKKKLMEEALALEAAAKKVAEAPIPSLEERAASRKEEKEEESRIAKEHAKEKRAARAMEKREAKKEEIAKKAAAEVKPEAVMSKEEALKEFLKPAAKPKRESKKAKAAREEAERKAKEEEERKAKEEEERKKKEEEEKATRKKVFQGKAAAQKKKDFNESELKEAVADAVKQPLTEGSEQTIKEGMKFLYDEYNSLHHLSDKNVSVMKSLRERLWDRIDKAYKKVSEKVPDMSKDDFIKIVLGKSALENIGGPSTPGPIEASLMKEAPKKKV